LSSELVHGRNNTDDLPMAALRVNAASRCRTLQEEKKTSAKERIEMNRRELLQTTTMFGLASTLPFPRPVAARTHIDPTDVNPLKPPAQGSIPVAFVISEGAVIIDFCGPWEVFGNVNVPDRQGDPFHLYTVGPTTKPIHAGGGMKIIPDYTFENAPAPKVIVIPAQNGSTDAMLDWIRKATRTTDVTMSVCTGAFILASTGLLSGKAATTHHAAYKAFAVQFPDIRLKRGARFVEDGKVATAGGLSSGIDLALHVVERYFGREVATQTAYQMEYQGQGWLDSASNQVYAKAPVSTDQHPLCPVCDMEVDPKSAPKSVYRGKTYYFCMDSHKAAFDAAPEKYLTAAE
jgi:YHS domain-containing protein/putative intracellular protease/amidase